MPQTTDFTTLSLAQVSAGLDGLARETQQIFGRLDARQLNWKPDETRWSVAQCLEHLLATNRLMLVTSDEAFGGTRRPTLWQRMPILPGLFGRMLVRSQSPAATRKFTAAPIVRPASSDIAGDVVQRFVDQLGEASARAKALDDRLAARTIITSPLAGFVTYSVLDGWRLVLAHGWRHVEQARRVTQSPGFPGAAAGHH
jgi:hypothetical protein